MSGVALALRQVRYENRAFWRNPPAAFFTFAFPLIFLVLFNVIFGGGEIETERGAIGVSTFYVPAIAAFSVITACYTNLAMTLSLSRDLGVLKRIRGTPLPGWAYLTARIIHAVLVAIALVVLVAAFGVVFYDVEVPANTLPAALVAVAAGAATFCALGIAVAGLVPNGDAAPAVVNATILPLLFVSDVFIPLEQAPEWLSAVSWLFPVRHFAEALHTAFDPFEAGAGFEPLHLAVVLAWGVAGALIAFRTFTWAPRR